jgi:hypothetical protein
VDIKDIRFYEPELDYGGDGIVNSSRRRGRRRSKQQLARLTVCTRRDVRCRAEAVFVKREET